MVSLVVACSSNWVIGRDGTLPWRLPGDLARFREITHGGHVVMGRKTYESLPPSFRPLPGRVNHVITSNASHPAEGIEVHPSFDVALAAAGPDAFVIGGGEVFRQALDRADRIYLTWVDAEVDGDASFPELDAATWVCVAESEPASENGFTYVFREYERRVA